MRLASTLPLPAALSSPTGRSYDVAIREGAPDSIGTTRTALGHEVGPTRAVLRFPPEVIVGIDNGTEITVQVGGGYPQSVFDGVLLGPVLGAVLLQREVLALHASCVVGTSGAIVIAADAGGGKSVTAGYLHQAGYRLVADDITAVSFAGDAALVTPAYPLLKLWPEGVTALGLDPLTVPVIEPGFGKQGLDVRARFSHEPVRIEVIVILVRNGGSASTLVQGSEAISALLSASYGRTVLEASSSLAWHFAALAELARHVRIVRVHCGSDLSPGEVAGHIIREVSHVGGL